MVAQPQPCQYVVAAQMAAQQQQQLLTQPQHPILGVHAHSPVKMAVAATSAVKSVKSAPPPPPPRTTPVSTSGGSTGGGSIQQQQPQAQPQPQAASAMRPVPNPVLQRPGGAQQFHESPDEGYHEDDNGSEAL